MSRTAEERISIGTVDAAPIAIDIAEESPLWRGVPETAELVERAVAAAVDIGKLEHRDGAELSVVLTDDSSIRVLNATWRQKDKPTNVLSFPAVSADQVGASPLLGDIVLAFETMEREARELEKPLSDHLTHLTVHGLLHLFGYDHENEADAAIMEALETRILAELGLDDPYAGFLPDAPTLRTSG